MPAPLAINSIEFARKALEIHDRIAVSQFPRLHDLLASMDSELDYSLQGLINGDNQPVLRLQIESELRLQCQRCLEAFPFQLSVDSAFVLVDDDAAIPSEDDEDFADQEYLVADTQMSVLELVEDEMLLALPYTPKHDEAQCGAIEMLNELKKPSPFAVLQGLKTGKH